MKFNTIILIAVGFLLALLAGDVYLKYRVDRADPAACNFVCDVVGRSTQIVNGVCYCVKKEDHGSKTQ